jgi:hypothetical protein
MTMPNYFKPLRQKIGVLTLGLACLFMAGWVRSLTLLDMLELPGRSKMYTLASMDSSLGWQISPHIPKNVNRLSWDSLPIDRPLHEVNVGWHWQFAGFKSGESSKAKFWLTPYWSIVCPLTLISLWLLLSKPHKSIQKKTDEPIFNEGT